MIDELDNFRQKLRFTNVNFFSKYRKHLEKHREQITVLFPSIESHT